jgi:hypothetical protein
MGILTVLSLYAYESTIYIRKHNIKPPEVKHRYETQAHTQSSIDSPNLNINPNM